MSHPLVFLQILRIRKPILDEFWTTGELTVELEYERLKEGVKFIVQGAKLGTPKCVIDLKPPFLLWVHFQNQTLFSNNFCIQYPNATFSGVLEPPFTCQQEHMNIWSVW